jgi:hypothetical protein
MKDIRILKDNRRVNSMLEIERFENDFNLKLPDFLRAFILKYEGCRPVSEQSYYWIDDETYCELNQVLYLRKSDLGGASIETILGDHKRNHIEGFIPFAIDSGGWDFDVSINEETYGQVWTNKFDSGEEDAMQLVAPSFDEFIDGLTADS